MDFVDLEFKDYLTPVILKAIWGLCLVLAALGVTAGALSIVASAYYMEEGDVMPLTWKLLAWGASIGFIMVWLLMVRVICESFMVVFNIADSLSSINKKIKVAYPGG